MAEYKQLLQTELDAERDDDYTPSHSPSPIHASADSRATKIFKAAAFFLLVLNIILSLANAWSGAGVGAALKAVLPAYDPRTLPRPDQYYGLPEELRKGLSFSFGVRLAR
jgi:hypothetical protein